MTEPALSLAYLLADMPVVGADGLSARRTAAAEWFAEHGLPSRKEEAWRFTPLKALTEKQYVTAGEVTEPLEELAHSRVEALRERGFAGYFLVYINGTCFAALSDFDKLNRQSGVTAGCLANADLLATVPELGSWENWQDSPFVALNTATFRGGVLLELAKNVRVDQPIYILHLVQGGVQVQHRNFFRLAAGAEASIVELHLDGSDQGGWHNSVNEATVAAGATLRHYRLQQADPSTVLTGASFTDVADHGQFHDGSYALGAQLSRQNIVCRLQGQGAHVSLTGLYLVDGDRVADHHTRIEHNQPHGTSHQLYKGILDEHARGVFNGRVLVAQDAQKTNADQASRVLLLSDDAITDANPELEIYADDVRCTHGSTTGFLDGEAVFYLRSRGVPLDEARRMIVQAFAAEVADQLDIIPLREAVLDEIRHRLGVSG